MPAGKVRTTFDGARLQRAVAAANFRSLGHAGGAIRKTAQRSIKKGKGPSAPGTPPHTRRGALPAAILYAVDKARGCVLVGVSAALLGPAGRPHEAGGAFRGDRYPKRPFMVPALFKLRSRLPSFWRDSVREV